MYRCHAVKASKQPMPEVHFLTNGWDKLACSDLNGRLILYTNLNGSAFSFLGQPRMFF